MVNVIWTATKIDQVTDCIMQFYLINIKKVKFDISGRQAMGIFLHRVIENFYKEKEGAKEPHYKSAESFANAIGGRWLYFLNESKKVHGGYFIRGKKIKWENDSEMYILKQEIKDMCLNIYKRYSKEEPPLMREINFEFIFEGKHYRGRIDEIRKNGVIRDIKTGKRKPGKMKLKYDPQFTLYALALGNLCYTDLRLSEFLGISHSEARRLAGNPDYMSEKIKLEYYFVRENKIYTMKRSNMHYYDFIEMLDGLERKIEEALINGVYPERGRRCDTCNVKQFCDKITRKRIHKKGQLILFAFNEQWKREKKAKQLKLFKK